MSKEKPAAKNRICHFVMQGKGGVGKTFISWLIGQNYLERKKNLKIFDVDPMNQSLTSYKGLAVEPYTVMQDDDQTAVDDQKMDDLIYNIMESDSDVLIDTGLSSFLAINTFLIEQDVCQVMEDNANVQTYIHCVIRDDAGMKDSLSGLKSLCEGYKGSNVKLYVWLNELNRGVRSEDGKEFEDFKVYKDHKDQISGIVRLGKQKSSYLEDLTRVLSNGLTIDQAINKAEFKALSKSRLHQLKNYYNSAIQVHF